MADEHEHYGPGQPMNAADVAAIIAERDRLRDELAVYRDQALPDAARVMNGLSTALTDVEAELDRLRAVVRKLATAAALSSDDRSVYERALDGSAAMGVTDAVTPEEMGNPDWYRED